MLVDNTNVCMRPLSLFQMPSHCQPLIAGIADIPQMLIRYGMMLLNNVREKNVLLERY